MSDRQIEMLLGRALYPVPVGEAAPTARLEKAYGWVRGQLDGLRADADTVRADKRLSDEGKAERLKALRERFVAGVLDGAFGKEVERAREASAAWREQAMAEAWGRAPGAIELEAARAVREYFRTLAGGERAAFLLKIAETGDKAALLGLASVPRYVVGLSEDEWNGVREAALRTFAPNNARLFAETDAAVEVAERNAATVRDLAGEVTSPGFQPPRRLQFDDGGLEAAGLRAIN